VVYTRCGIAALAGLAEAQRQQRQLRLAPFRELDLDERQALLLHVLGGWAQGVGIDVAECVVDD
jgi:hypothetical protein